MLGVYLFRKVEMTGSLEDLLVQQIQMEFGDVLFVFLGCGNCLQACVFHNFVRSIYYLLII